MKKVFALIVATAMCLATLTACGGSKDATTSAVGSTPTTSAGVQS
jgi:maltose-binding protein MalE